MRTLSKHENGRVAAGLMRSPTGKMNPELKRLPPDSDDSSWVQAQQIVGGVTDSMMASIADDMYTATLGSEFFTTSHPEDATESERNTTCNILESDCTHWGETGTHLDNFTGSIINPDFIDWDAYGSYGNDAAIDFVQNLNDLLGDGTSLMLDPNYSPTYGEFFVDQRWIFDQENATDSLRATIPGSGHSGITVAHGVDLGQMSVDDLKALHLSPALTAIITPYVGSRTLADAQTFLAKNPLTLAHDQAQQLDYAEYTHTLGILAQNFDAASSGFFTALPQDTQTAIADLAYQYGPNLYLPDKAPKFWSDITTGNWNAAYNELMNFDDAFGPRRQSEAALLKHDIDTKALP